LLPSSNFMSLKQEKELQAKHAMNLI